MSMPCLTERGLQLMPVRIMSDVGHLSRAAISHSERAVPGVINPSGYAIFLITTELFISGAAAALKFVPCE